MKQVEAKNYLTEVPTDYVKKSDIPSLDGYAKTEEIPTDYLTEADLAGYSKFSGSYNDLTDKPEIPSVDGLASESYVDEAVKNITVDTSNLATLEQLNAKANDVLFTESKIVKTAIGGFVVDEDIKDLTIAQLFAKLLGFSLNDPDQPDTPEEPSSLIDKLMANQQSLYQIDDTGLLHEVSYKYSVYTPDDAAKLGSDTSFYQIKDGDTVVESGYEHYTEPQDMYYIMALPSELILGENVTVKAWDEGLSAWQNINAAAFTCDYSEIEAALGEADFAAPIVPDGYTLWADLSDINSGMSYRFIINEEA
jgi:hypothetical protein